MLATETAMKGRLLSRVLMTFAVWPFSRGAGLVSTRSLLQR